MSFLVIAVAEIAFPTFVRGMLVGVFVPAAKRSGEACDPEERNLLAELSQRVGIALDALQTASLRRELNALAAHGATGGVASAL